MNSKKFLQRGLLIWLMLCLLSSVLLYAELIRRQFWELDREFATAYTEIGAVLTQNESVLPLLNGDEDLAALGKKFPQILGLQKTQGRALDAARVEPLSGTQYWLYNPWRQIRVLIDLAPVINAWPRFTRITLNLTGRLPSPSTDAFWHWQRQFPQHTQPFVLLADARPAWLNVTLLPFILLFIGWAVVVAAGGLILWQRKQRQNADRRAWYYQHARLNTLGEITAGIVHEINQPLTAVQTWIQGAQRQLDQDNPAAVSQALGSALVQTRRIGELLTRFREHVTQDAVTLGEVDLAECWQHVGNLLEHERTARHIRLTHDFAADAQTLCADRLWLEQVLHNLLSNAIQAQQDRAAGWVHIRSHREGERVHVEIADGGPGFTPEALHNAFMPFYSGREGGTGLGMTLTESLVTRMNGTLALDNAPEGGARIRLQFAHHGSQVHG
ncbi:MULTISPECIES: sensor histidine kinase [unclassified Leclercia]|uniref:histidine kinase n=1 Tax=Leclercia barmai TaxID=2785629 RepID=A0ABS7RSV7_9ENTR|nr:MULTISPECIES: ATP-binding protein [unclassified Leclercia]MBZ0057390.1 ATP-binding protein [Leclercia sp. EMC7]MCM5695557.1 ATP-binding protein [Leclercia sp. LTM01]MCM5699965.1 ATP-binding protein [Leclercia sp. LTM14]